MTDKTIFNGDDDDQIPARFDEGGYLPPGEKLIVNESEQPEPTVNWGTNPQWIGGKWVLNEDPKIPEPGPEKPEWKPGLFGKIMARVVLFGISMVLVAGCVWLVAAILANLPTR